MNLMKIFASFDDFLYYCSGGWKKVICYDGVGEALSVSRVLCLQRTYIGVNLDRCYLSLV